MLHTIKADSQKKELYVFVFTYGHLSHLAAKLFNTPEGLQNTGKAGGWPSSASSESLHSRLWMGAAPSVPALRGRTPHPAGAAHSRAAQEG